MSNDINYENIFAKQIEIKGNVDDLLIVLSGSGNSPNILKAIEVGNQKIKTFAIVGFDGGKCKKLAKKYSLFDKWYGNFRRYSNDHI